MSSPSPPKTILVVDDDPDTLEAVADVLQYDGHEVATASNGLDALRKLQSGSRLPDAILLDLMMPVMDGWAFIAEVRKVDELARIPVVVFTADAEAKAIANSLNTAGYLGKPLRMDELLKKVQQIVSTR